MTQTLTTTDELKHLASSDNTNELTRSLARECLANREAQPVAFYGVTGNNCAYYNTRKGAIKDGCEDITPLYTAPPAPVVNSQLTGATAVPEAIITAPVEAMRCGPAASYVMGWNACRAAMLAQPISQGYKLVPVEPTEEMIAAAMNCDDVEFNSDETFCVNFDNIYRAMLAAAPEGGN